MNFITIVFIIVFGAGLLLGVMARAMLTTLRQRGKARLYMHDPDSGVFQPIWVRLADAEPAVKYGGKLLRLILPQDARMSAWPPTWIVHARHGFAFRALTDKETTDSDPLRNRLAASNPEAYHLHTARNRVAQALRANDQSDKYGWVKFAIVVGSIAVCLIIAGLVYALVAISKNKGG